MTPPTSHQGGAAEMREALDLIRSAHDRCNIITNDRRRIGPIATQAQTAGHALAKAEALLRALPLPAAEAPQGWREVVRLCAALPCSDETPGLNNLTDEQAERNDRAIMAARQFLPAAPSTLREGEGA